MTLVGKLQGGVPTTRVSFLAHYSKLPFSSIWGWVRQITPPPPLPHVWIGTSLAPVLCKQWGVQTSLGCHCHNFWPICRCLDGGLTVGTAQPRKCRHFV